MPESVDSAGEVCNRRWQSRSTPERPMGEVCRAEDNQSVRERLPARAADRGLAEQHL